MKRLLLTLALATVGLCHATELNYNCGGMDIMGIYLNGFFVEMGQPRIRCEKFTGNTFVNQDVRKVDKDFSEYTFRRGAITGQGNRFWMLGGEGTINNRKWQPMDIVMTATVSAEGKIEGLKKVRPLPHPVTQGRALIHDNRLWHLGGFTRNELISAEILPDGELGEWKFHRSYPLTVSSGGFVLYKGCFYANGKTTYWPGSTKMYAIKLKDLDRNKPWRRVEAPPNKAMGALFVHRDALYYFDEISATIFKTAQEADGIQLKEWQVAGKMPSPPKTEYVSTVAGPGGWFIFGGCKRGENNRFAGFFKGTFLPESQVK